MKSLGGNVCIRNGNDLDYCWRECIESLLPVCDEVVVCDGESTDGTTEEIRQWSEKEPRIKLCIYPWPNPHRDNDFWVNWMNYARCHIRCDYQLQLDADEVLSENSYTEIENFKNSSAAYPKRALWCNRYNFWRDAQSLIPHGVCCSHRVVRVAPQEVWLPSDGPHVRGNDAVNMAVDSKIEIFHYGFLRKPQAFFRKARALQGYFFGSYDKRLAAVENSPDWMREMKDLEWIDQLLPFGGVHPKVAVPWLQERGHKV